MKLQSSGSINPFAKYATSETDYPVTKSFHLKELYGEDPPWGPNGKAVYERTYSRVDENGTEEEWADTVLRVVDGNLAYVDPEYILPGEREYLLESIYNFKTIPAGRHLWSTGAPGVNATANCFVAPWGNKLSDHFCWLFDHLMTGSGVGANYSQVLINENSPDHPSTQISLYIQCDSTHPNHDEVNPDLPVGAPFVADEVYKVEDSRQGWVKALKIIIDRSTRPHIQGRRIVLDVSSVRGRGEPIRGFGGVASGPGPLVDLLRSVCNILNNTTRLTPIEAMEIDHEIARCVVAGNVRRSARMACLNWDDPYIEEFLVCKEQNEQGGASHWTANISVAVDAEFINNMNNTDHPASLIHQKVTEGMVFNGEPGYLNLDLANKDQTGQRVWATNPCGEQFLEQGSACTLAHVNLAAMIGDSLKNKKLAFIAMSRFALRSLNREYLDEIEEFATKEYRRIGVGFFGLQEYAASHGVPYSKIPNSMGIEVEMKAFYEAVRTHADNYSDLLGWNRPKAVTTVAPTGTIATMAGKSTGCEPILFPYYNRLVRFANNDSSLQDHIENGLYTEPCISSAETTIVYFPTKDSILDTIEEELIEASGDIDIETHLRIQAFLQECFVDNAISKTIGIDVNTDPQELAKSISKWLPSVKGLTVFPEASHAQAPFQAMSKADYELSSFVEEGGYVERDCGPLGCPIK